MAQLPRLEVRDRPRPTRCPEPLCPLWVLPFKEWPHHLERHYPLIIAHTGSCARAKPSRCLRSPCTAGLCRLSAVPAGRWPFPRLSPPVFPQMPGPLPRWDPMVHMPVLPTEHRPSPYNKRVGSHTQPVQRLQYGTFTRLHSFRYVQAPRFAHHPGRSYRSPQELGSRDFYFQAPHGLLPCRVPDILAV